MTVPKKKIKEMGKADAKRWKGEKEKKLTPSLCFYTFFPFVFYFFFFSVFFSKVGNYLSGTIPSELGQLTQLWELRLCKLILSFDTLSGIGYFIAVLRSTVVLLCSESLTIIVFANNKQQLPY